MWSTEDCIASVAVRCS